MTEFLLPASWIVFFFRFLQKPLVHVFRLQALVATWRMMTSSRVILRFSPTVCAVCFHVKIKNLQFQLSFWIKPTDAPNSNFIGTNTLHVSDNLSAHHQEFLAVHRLWYILCSCDEPFATRSRMEPGSYSWKQNVHHNCIKCTKADVRLRTPDDGQKGCPKHVEY